MWGSSNAAVAPGGGLPQHIHEQIAALASMANAKASSSLSQLPAAVATDNQLTSFAAAAAAVTSTPGAAFGADPRTPQSCENVASSSSSLNAPNGSGDTVRPFADADETNESSRTIHISNLPPTTTEQQLIDLFSSCGPLSYVRLVDHATHCFAFVEFMDAGGAHAAYALNGMQVGDYTIRMTSTLNQPQVKPYVKRDKGLMRRLTEINDRILNSSPSRDPPLKESKSPTTAMYASNQTHSQDGDGATKSSSRSRSQNRKEGRFYPQSPRRSRCHSSTKSTTKVEVRDTKCPDRKAYIPFQSSKLPATPLEHLHCLRKKLVELNPSLMEDAVSINLDEEGREQYEAGRAVRAVVEVDGVNDCADIVIPSMCTFSAAADGSLHTVVLSTAKAYPSFAQALNVAYGRPSTSPTPHSAASNDNDRRSSRRRSRSRKRNRSRSKSRRKSRSSSRSLRRRGDDRSSKGHKDRDRSARDDNRFSRNQRDRTPSRPFYRSDYRNSRSSRSPRTRR